MIKLTGTAYRKMQKNLKEAGEIMEFFDEIITAEEKFREEEAKSDKGQKPAVQAEVKNVNTNDVNELLKRAEEKVNKRTANVYTNYSEADKPAERAKTNSEREAELDERIKAESLERKLYEEEAARLREVRLAFERERAEFLEFQRKQKYEQEQISKRDRDIENDLRRLAELRRRQDILTQIVDVNLTEDKTELLRREKYLNELLYRDPRTGGYNMYNSPYVDRYQSQPAPLPEAPKYNAGYKDSLVSSADEVLKQYQMLKKGAVSNVQYQYKNLIKSAEDKIEPKVNVYTTYINPDIKKAEKEPRAEIKEEEKDTVAEQLFEPIIKDFNLKADEQSVKPEEIKTEIMPEVKPEEVSDEVETEETEDTEVKAGMMPESIETAEEAVPEVKPEETSDEIETEEVNDAEVKTESEEVNDAEVRNVSTEPEEEKGQAEEIKENIVEYDAGELGLDFDTPVYGNANSETDAEMNEEEYVEELETAEEESAEDVYAEPELGEELELEEEQPQYDPNNPYGLSKRNIKELEFIRTMSKKEVKENAVIKYITSGEEYFQEVIESILSAKKYIAIEVSTIKEGRIWASVKEILKNKAAEDIPVYLLYNSFGVPDKPLTANMSALDKGMFNVASFYEDVKKDSALNKITGKIGSILFGSGGSSGGRKRKGIRTMDNSVNLKNMIIVDGKVCYIGSVGFTDAYANIDTSENAKYVKSAGMKIIGNSTSHYVEMFVKDFNAITGEKLEANKMSASDIEIDAVAFNRTGGLMASAAGRVNDMDEIVEQIIFNSTDYVCVAMPYYAITDGILSSLVVAAKTLVDVRVYISPYRIRSDFEGAVKKFEDRFGDSGVKLYKYNYGELNCNLVLSDDECVLMGNMPYEATVKTEKSEAYIIGINAIESVKKDILEINDYSVILNERKKRG